MMGGRDDLPLQWGAANQRPAKLMLYILVNNDYHLQALRRHGIATLGGQEGVKLITVPHALSPTIDVRCFRDVYRFDTPLGRKRLPAALWHYRAQARTVVSTLQPGPDDTLLFFTEVEWLNQIVVYHFRRCGAHIVMLEDGGFGTYIPMSVAQSDPLSLRERFIQAAYRLLPGLNRSRLFKVDGQLFPRMADIAIDEIALYRNVPLNRCVSVRHVRRPARKPCDIRPGSVVFLNERMYDHYQTGDAYLTGLRRLMTALTKGFASVHFKFHPREPESWKTRIRALLSREFPAIEVIEQPGIIEDMIQNYRPAVLASYFSTPLLNIEYEGIEPLYLYHLLDDVRDQPVFSIVSRILGMWGYRFVSSDSEVRSGYRSGMADGPLASVELSQLLSPQQLSA
jgi:hypothetical protein